MATDFEREQSELDFQDAGVEPAHVKSTANRSDVLTGYKSVLLPNALSSCAYITVLYTGIAKFNPR